MIAVINSDKEIENAIETALMADGFESKELKFINSEDTIFDFVKFYFPEIIIINLSDPALNIDDAVSAINQDRRFLNFGVIGIFSASGEDEQKLLAKYRTSNVITFLENYRIRSNLAMIVKIILQNYQLIFQSDFASNMREWANGSLYLENNLQAVSSYTGIITTMLVRRGIIRPESKIQLQLALEELIVNGIEHGNCGISYDEKTKGMESGKSVLELIAEKITDPKIAAKKVEVGWNIKENETILSIIDQGVGFDVIKLLEKLKSQDAYLGHGRGIRIASAIAREVKYSKKGNKVSMYLTNEDVEHDAPPGLLFGEPFIVKKGDVIIREGEASDCLFYITSGRYGVYVNDKRIDTITPNEIFLGEMAFILNQSRTATIIAECPGKLIRITHKVFIDIIREYPHYIMFLSRLIAQRLLRRSEKKV
ncbi:MAG: cyclic nucleotide-binding domain-containing protein [Spirochaetaceae bacterium]|jgi:anti-sigma regulatory factor (Ser/Thr protein kinase)|nr:cyclic nucleotide-binding domain-containing protein [Spirochaetaceae bacterium]